MTEKQAGHPCSGLVECRVCNIRDSVLFADLEEPDFSLIDRPIDEMTLEPGAVLFDMGQDAASVFTVRSGLIKLVGYLPDGTQRIVRLLRAGSVAGLEALLGGPYEHSAVALQTSVVCRIPVDVVHRLDRETPRLHGQLMTRWHQSVSEANEWLISLSTGNAKARVARLLLFLGEDENGQCHLFTREDVGAILGITPETASLTVAAFKRDGLINQVAQNVFTFDDDALKSAAGYDE